ncbi:MAG: transcription-repair coupling factor [Planctomycetia bacterium]|nr:transcription-repair coupling factor [Planctomycetia bacterium]
MEVLPEITTHALSFCEKHAILSLVESRKTPHIEGVWGAGASLLAAALSHEAPEKTCVIVAPTQKIARNIVSDFRLFNEREALYFPPLQRRWFEGVDSADEDRLALIIPDATVGERLRVLKALSDGEPHVVVASIQALLWSNPTPETLRGESISLRAGDALQLDTLADWLVSHGFQNTSAVQYPGEFFVRGGLIDIFAVEWDVPLRIEFFGDEIDSIRTFDLESQRSLERLDAAQIGSFLPIMQPPGVEKGAELCDFLDKESLFMILEPEETQIQGKRFREAQEGAEAFFTTEQILRRAMDFPFLSVSAVGESAFGKTFRFPMESVERFSGDFSRVKDELERYALGQQVYLLSPNEAESARVASLLEESLPAKNNALHLRVGSISHGFRLIDSRALVLTSAALFGRDEAQTIPKIATKAITKAIDSFSDLSEGDYVVHISHGIARYHGLKLLEPLKSKGEKSPQDVSVGMKPNAAGAEEHLALEFRDNVMVYVPATKIGLVQKYINTSGTPPRLSTYGGKVWRNLTKSVSESVVDLASEMLEIQAQRASKPGIAFPTGTTLQNEFDALFPYAETPDQLEAASAIRADMAQTKPMDRLLCGDVGFGKTELAMRAAFTAAEAGYQTAVLVPTTILAAQHWRSFTQRMAAFPIVVESISRFSSASEQREVLKRVEKGSVDILIGTHRLASANIRFHNLGLVIIDEEQRFGVEIKESLKRFRSTVDVLTMTATPIPRTLHMSLLGIRDISSLETPPEGRMPVSTIVTRFNPDIVKNAIRRELDREGQIYFVHNRVYDIDATARMLHKLVPDARIEVGHAQMPEKQLENVMLRFVNHECDILVSTTIVENGLDIPNANTIFIDNADRYGLAELHQLRGRVGRFRNHAYCYLIVNDKQGMTESAIRRLKAIEEFSHLGAGFSIAMRDLEIRGAGNILGAKQSGQIALVGYELYCDLLENAVRRLRRMPPRETVETDVDLPVSAYIPHEYVPDMRAKIDLYRQLSRCTRVEHIEELELAMKDRFGPIPPPLARLLQVFRIRIHAHQRLIHTVRRENDFIVLHFYSRKAIEPLALRKIGKMGKSLRIADETSAYLPMDDEVKNSPPDSEKMLNYVELLLR